MSNIGRHYHDVRVRLGDALGVASSPGAAYGFGHGAPLEDDWTEPADDSEEACTSALCGVGSRGLGWRASRANEALAQRIEALDLSGIVDLHPLKLRVKASACSCMFLQGER